MSMTPAAQETSRKGLGKGTVGLLGAMVIGISCIAPAYTLTGALGPTVSVVGTHVPAVFIVGFIPMLLTAFGYKQLNARMPDSGTSFTWATRAFGPWVGWMAGWGLIVATVVVLSNLAGIAVDFFYLALSQLFSNPDLADLTDDPLINVITCLAFIAIAVAISYRDMQTTQKFQYALVGFQILVMLLFGGVALWHVANGTAFDATAITLDDFNPFTIDSFSSFASGISLSLFIFWGWDVILTMNEETKDPERTPGRAATISIFVIIGLYLFVTVGLMAFAGVGDGEYGLNNPDIQENVFFALAGPVLGPLAILVSLAVLMSSAASLQSTAVGPARTLLSMGHYGALPRRFARVHPRYLTPGFATVVSGVVAAVFYTVMRFLSEAVLWDTITTLGMMICFYYGLTALSAVWYFRHEWFRSVRNALETFLFPLVGGLVLVILFFVTLVDSLDPDYGSGSSIGGIGLVFILGLVLILSGVVVMVWRYFRSPAFFRGETGLRAGVAGDAEEALLHG
jgi:amino acid transporter